MLRGSYLLTIHNSAGNRIIKAVRYLRQYFIINNNSSGVLLGSTRSGVKDMSHAQLVENCGRQILAEQIIEAVIETILLKGVREGCQRAKYCVSLSKTKAVGFQTS